MKTFATLWFLGLSLLFTGCESQQANFKTVAVSKTDNNAASSKYGYTPPSYLFKSARRSTATEECAEAIYNSPTTLHPTRVAARKTTSTHPTFLVQLNQFSRKSIIFTFGEPDVAEPIFQKILPAGLSGVTAIKLPQELSGLKIGKQYRWDARTLCDDSQAYKSYVGANIERVVPAPSLKQKLASATSDYKKRAQLYDQFGIGYDAISTVYEAYTANPKPPSDSKIFDELLKKNLQSPIMAESSNSKAFEDLLRKNLLVQ